MNNNPNSVCKRIRAEKIFELAFEQVIPGAIHSRQLYVGGPSCAINVDGTKSCDERTRAAYIDLNFVKHEDFNTKLNIIIEIDESRGHGDRDPTCEMARLDALKWGIDEIIPTIIVRVNSDESHEVSMEDKIRAVTQYVLNLLESPHDHLFAGIDEYAVTVMQYLFYPKDSPHVKMVERYPHNFKILAPIESMTDERIKLGEKTSAILMRDLIQRVDNKCGIYRISM